MRTAVLISLVSLLASDLTSRVLADDDFALPLNLSVMVEGPARTDAVVVFDLPKGFAATDIRLVEIIDQHESPVVAQIAGTSQRLYWIAHGVSAAGSSRRFRLERGKPSETPLVTALESETGIEIGFRKQTLLRYNKAHVEPPPGMDPLYGRSAHLHPVRTPKGILVSDEFPPDHAHQSGIFRAFTKTQFNGQEVDFWNLAGGKGRVRFARPNEVASGPLFARFSVEHEHVLFSSEHPTADHGKTGGQVALTETWEVRAWSGDSSAGIFKNSTTPENEHGCWILDITSQIRCATEMPLILPEYHYGGMALRAAREWIPEHVRFVTSEGADRIQGNHSRPRWCDISGKVGGQMAGITLMTHPTNFRFPEPLRIHPTMPYMVYTPSFLGDWQIVPGATHAATYRFVIHDGELSHEAIENHWRNFAQPLVAKIE